MVEIYIINFLIYLCLLLFEFIQKYLNHTKKTTYLLIGNK